MDKFFAAYRDVVVTNYANFAGRVDVGRFWRFVAVNVAISVLLSFLWGIRGVLFYVAAGAYWLVLLVPSIAAAVRRLHDSGKTGWLALVWLIPFIGPIILIVLCIQPGDPESNEYGPPYVPY